MNKKFPMDENQFREFLNKNNSAVWAAFNGRLKFGELDGNWVLVVDVKGTSLMLDELVFLQEYLDIFCLENYPQNGQCPMRLNGANVDSYIEKSGFSFQDE